MNTVEIVCTRCRVKFPGTEEFFRKIPRGNLTKTCIECLVKMNARQKVNLCVGSIINLCNK